MKLSGILALVFSICLSLVAEELTDVQRKLAYDLYTVAKKKRWLRPQMKNQRAMFPTKGYQTVILNGTPKDFTMKGDGSPRDQLKGKTVRIQLQGTQLLVGDKPYGSPIVSIKFKRILDIPYPRHSGTLGGDMAIGDINGDKRKDIIISGICHTKAMTKIYLQKADGRFERPTDAVSDRQTAHGLPGLDRGACIKLADMDGDGKLDAVMYGCTRADAKSALFKVYKGKGDGTFEVMYDLGKDLPLEDFEDVIGSWGKGGPQPDLKTDKDVKGIYNAKGWSAGVLELVDLDLDGDKDIVYAGCKGMESGTDPDQRMIYRDWEASGVFLNDGNGKFTYLTGPGYPQAGIPKNPEVEPVRCFPQIAQVNRGFSATADFNGDKVPDLVVFGQANIGPKANAGVPETQRNCLPIAEVYLGKKDGTFTVIKEHGLPALIDGAVTPADLNKDGKIDLVVLGNTGHPRDPAGGRVTKIFFGNGDGTFKLDTAQTYEKVPGSADWIVPTMSGEAGLGDIDGDGDIDMVIAGNMNDRSLYLYLNNKGKFSFVGLNRIKDGIGTNNARGMAQADATTECDVSVTDMDGDGDVDIVVNGRGGSTHILVFYNQLK